MKMNNPVAGMLVRLLIAVMASIACPAQTGWTQWPASSGGNDHWYLAVYVPGGINWADARTQAQTLGGDLAVITSAAENTFVFQRISNPIFWRVVANPTRIFGPWIGAFQPVGSPEPAGGWTWVTGEAWSYTHWSSGEPNNYQGIPEDRVHFFTTGTSPRSFWNDVRQSTLVPGFVVESATQPPAAYVSLGVGCDPNGTQPPTMSPLPNEVPRLGTTSHLRVSSYPVNATLGFVCGGLTNRYAMVGSSVVRLPINLGAYGWGGCFQMVSVEAMVSHSAAGAFFDHPVAVPNDVALLGTAAFFQALVLTPSSAVVTNSIAGYVGL